MRGDGNDFKSYVELGLEDERASECVRAGLSTFDSYESANALKGALRYFRSHTVKCANLDKSHGVYKRTGPTKGHHTLWPLRTAIAMLPALFAEGERA